MRSRIYWMIIILTVAVSMTSAQPVSAKINCDTNVQYVFPEPPLPWYTISASKDYPKRPVVKQQLEELAARGILSQPPSYYYAQFKANVSLEPGNATWNTIEKRDEWEYDPPCTRPDQEKGLCKGRWKKVDECVSHSAPVYRSIQTMKFFLIPTDKTQLWYGNREQSPSVMLAYPDFWMPVAIGEGGDLYGDFFGDMDGPHFFYSYPLWSEFYLPSKLPQIVPSFAVINQDDLIILSKDIEKVIPVCDVNEENDIEHGYVSAGVFNYGYDNSNWLNTDIDADPYHCTASATVADNKIQSIDLKITDYDFDIPGTFYIGIVTQISPAVSPVDPTQTEPVPDPKIFEPSNIDINKSFENTVFTVWMIVSTPCWSGDGGCDTENILK